MTRVLYLVYGAVAYILFLGTALYAIGFVENFHIDLGAGMRFVPRSLDSGDRPAASAGVALLVDIGLLLLFGLQHSGMARRGFKRLWTRVVPAPIERSTYVLFTSLCLMALFLLWRPIPVTLWQVSGPAYWAIIALSLVGWVLVIASSFLLSHADLLGVRQVLSHAGGRAAPAPAFATPGLYKLVRHPTYLGFLIAFWAAPVMTAGHLLFATAMTAYILVAVQLEERDLVREHGDDYREYRRRVGMLLPRRR
jgi:protein-S-isoprenylcysteine O-methyltransferase Ste14